MCSFVCSGFLKRLFMPLALFIHDILKLRLHLDTEMYGRLPWQFCNFTCEIANYRWNFAPKLRSNSSPMILLLEFDIPCHRTIRYFKGSICFCRRKLVINWVTFIFDFGMGVGKTRNTEHSGTSRNMKKTKIIFRQKNNNNNNNNNSTWEISAIWLT